MPLSSTLVWEVRTTGNAANGGAFRAGATGTDYSQQATPQVSYTDLVVDATTNTKVTSAANPFTAAHVGNVIKISSPSPWTPGYYEIMSVTSGAATLHASPAATASTGGVGKLGGAADSLVTIAPFVVGSNRVWVKQGTYTHAASPVFTATVASITPSSPPTRIHGYGTTRGDGVRATISATGGITAISVAARSSVGNFDIGGTVGTGIQCNTASHIFNCKVTGATVAGLNASGSASVVESCEVGGYTGSNYAISNNAGITFGCYVHDCVQSIAIGAGSAIGNLVVNSLYDGIQCQDVATVIGNTVYGSGRHGINRTGTGTNNPGMTRNNVLVNNGGYGFLFAASAGLAASSLHDGNAYYGNTSGTRSNGDDTTVNPQNGSGPYTNTLDKILTASPFVNAAGGDFRLNNTAGGGAACRAAATPSSWPGSALASYGDMGAAQHLEMQATPGGGRIIGSGVIQPACKLA